MTRTTTPTPRTAASHPARQGWRARLAEVARFGTVGGIAFIVDIGLFNLLRFGPGELLGDKPIAAKVISVTVATLVAWLGNRYWTFAAHRTGSSGRELVAFAVVNVGGMLIAVGCLALSHYVLGLTSPLADNVSANGVGLVLGTTFRYFAYRSLVFTGTPGAGDGGAVAGGLTVPDDGAPRPPAHHEAGSRPGQDSSAPR